MRLTLHCLFHLFAAQRPIFIQKLPNNCAGLSARELGREGSSGPPEETEEVKEGRGGRGTGEGPDLKEPVFQVRDDPAVGRRAASGVAPQGAPARDLLPAVPVARPPIAPRAQVPRLLQASLRGQRQSKRRLHDNLSSE